MQLNELTIEEAHEGLAKKDFPQKNWQLLFLKK